MQNYDGKNISSVNFRENDLKNKHFQKVQAGHKFYYKFLLASFGIATASILNIMPLLSGVFLDFVREILLKYTSTLSLLLLFIEIIIYAASLIRLIIYGYKVESSYFIAVLIVIGAILSIAPSTYYSGIGWTIVLLGLSITSAWIGAAITAFSVAFTSSCYGMVGEFITVLGSGITAIALPVIVKNIHTKTENVEVILDSVATIVVIFTGANIARQALKGSPKFAWIKEKAVFWAAIGGTSFYGADLTNASFDGADLRHTDFREANLTHTSFKGVTGLELARLQGSILEDPKVRKLLTTNNSRGGDFAEANLQGANLQGADLREAILVKAQVLDADFSGAFLTDACIQDWNINKNTRFQDIDCKRVYLKCSLYGNFLEPKPDSGEFQPGEFEKWITDVRDTIDLIFQNGLNWRAFAFSLTQTAINNEGLGLSVRSIENKGDGVVVAKVGVSLETNKTVIHEEITSHYNQAVNAIKAKYELVLQAKEGEIQRLQTFYDSQQKFIQGLITGIAETKREVIIKGEGNRVYMMNQAGDIMESNNQNISAGGNLDMSSGNRFIVGGDVTNSNLTLADANSQVNNSIQQLKDISTDTSDQLAKILTTLQKSINDEPALSENQKKEALEAVETIAEEGKKPSEERVNKLCSMALNALKGIASAVTDASKLAEVFKTYLPTLTNILGI
ncbi:MAG: pentapeptide repeat-containing protein [Nostoc sp.]|uniref:pentapeptide repeat-containing protein n=1 Tax=Nostoc sp. TaxID=1180 RepID=UPI002FFC752D